MVTRRKDFSTIEGISDIRQIVRMGKIHLGVKKKSAKGAEYPSATDYFVCPKEVVEKYGESPKLLEILVPCEDRAKFFPQAYKLYRSSGLFCKGNGCEAERIDDQNPGAITEISCPCKYLEDGTCKRMANFQFYLPTVTLGGVYQIDTSSIHSIININSGLDQIFNLFGRLNFAPALLHLVPQEVQPDGRKKIVWVMKLFPMDMPKDIKRLTENFNEVRQLVSSRLALPAPGKEEDLIPAHVLEAQEKNKPVDAEYVDDDGVIHETGPAPVAQEEINDRAVAAPNPAQITRLWTLATNAGLGDTLTHNLMNERFGKSSSKDLTLTEYDQLCDELTKLADARKAEADAAPADDGTVHVLGKCTLKKVDPKIKEAWDKTYGLAFDAGFQTWEGVIGFMGEQKVEVGADHKKWSLEDWRKVYNTINKNCK